MVANKVEANFLVVYERENDPVITITVWYVLLKVLTILKSYIYVYILI